MAEHDSGLRVIKPGFLSLLQDAGRAGVMHLGLATGGPMDRHAWAWANQLVNNPYHSAALEITLGGFECVAETAVQIAVTGAELSLEVNGLPQPLWSTLNLSPGDHITLGRPKTGVRSYLAVQGGFAVDVMLGNSGATLTRERTGGLQGDGTPLKAGDFLTCHLTRSARAQRQIPEEWLPDYTAPLILDVILGAQADRFASSTLATFFNSPYLLTPQSDRMGARLKGPVLEHRGKTLASEGTSLGAIQVPADGQPIVLLNDRQTIGGYPKLGAVTPRSLDALAQRMPGTEIRFNPVPLHAAQLQERDFLTFFLRTRADQRD